uniref:Nephrin/kirre n=1 Tax=Knipowitschia caucasica TaxID=637954 RepID=A0AAV2J7F4_KNICA
MVDPLLGLLSFLCTSLLLVSTHGYLTPPVPFPSSLEKLVPNPTGEVVYKNSSVFGVVDKAVILDCGPARPIPDIYIWSFTKPGSQEIKNVVYNLGKGPRMQTFARILGQVTVISDSASISIEQLALAAHGVFTCQAIFDTDREARFIYYYVYLTVWVPISKPYLVLSELSPVEGSTIWMRCNLENGTGPIQYEWHHENMNGSVTVIGPGNSNVIDVSKINRNNTGWYLCRAQNPVNSEQSDRHWLSIIFGPDEPKIDVTPYTMTERGYSALERETVSLLCQAQSNPPSQYVWLYNNSQVFGGPQYTITKILRMHTGDYTCLAQNTYLNTRSVKSISLTVYYPPEGLPVCSMEAVFNHSSLRLVCLWAGGYPAPNLSWSSDLNLTQQEKTDTDQVKNTAIFVASVNNTSNNSSFFCRGSHPAVPQAAQCSVHTYVPPEEPQCFFSVTDLNVTLSCLWEGGVPRALLWWDGPGGHSKSGLESSNNMTIRYGTLRTETPYTCHARHPLLFQSRTCKITMDPPVNSSSCSMEAVFNHSSLRLVCLWAGGYPAPNLSWSSDLDLTQQEETNADQVKNTAIFVASVNNTSNNSSFFCRGSHPAVPQAAQCSVHTYVPSEEPQCFFNVTDLNVTLSCLWEGGVPSALLWWDGPGGHSKSGLESSNNMTIRYGTLRTETPYTCHARHPLLFQSRTCKITMVAVSSPSLSVSETSPLEGSSISMICKVQNGTGPIHYEWHYNAQNGARFKVAQSNSTVLHLINLKHNQTGWYQCGASNLVNSQTSDPAWVDVIYPPVNSSSCSMEAVFNHSSLRLVCLWAGGYPAPNLSWSSDLDLTQQEETNADQVKNTAIFVASVNNTSNNSSFFCRGSHPAVPQAAQCSVHTYVPPEEPQCFFSVTDLNVTLSCLWEGGVPRALLWWDGPGGHSKSGLESSNNMTIRYGTLRTETPYTCHARHPLLFQSRTCKITMASLRKPDLIMSAADPQEGSTVWMRCSPKSGTEPIHFMWQYRDHTGNISTMEETTADLQLTVKRSHMGWYRCLVKNPVNNMQSDWTKLNVTYGPELLDINITPKAVAEQGYIALEQETVSLFCQAQSNPASHYIWFYNNSQVHNGPQFTLTNILRTQTGDYTCLAQNALLKTRSKKSISLTVYYPPDGQPICSVEGTLEHSSLRLLCRWSGGHPSPNLFWSGALVDQEGVNTKTNSATLMYSQGTASNNSLFKCQGSHMALKQTTGCSVQPYSPSGAPQCSAFVTSNNQRLMLSCSWDGGFPKALVWWVGPGVQGSAGTEATNILILRYGTVRSQQPYICHARHPLEAQTRTCTVPLEPPVLRTQRRTVTVFEGTDVQLTCSLMDNNLPSNEIIWFNNRGVGVMDTPKYLLLRSSAWANLTVRDTQETQDSGQYRCTTSNAVGGTEVNVTLVVKRHPMPPNASLVSVMYNSPQRNQVDLEWQVHNEEAHSGGWTGFILEYSWMFEKPGRRGGTNQSIILAHPEKIASIWYNSILQDPSQRTHTLSGLTPTVTYQFRITSINYRTLGHPSAPITPAEPRQTSLPAIIGAAIGGMLFAAILTALLLMYIIRNRNNNPRLHDLLFGRQHSQSRENINFPEDEVMGSAGGIEDIGGLSSSGATVSLPRAASPLAAPSQSPGPALSTPPFDDGNEPVNVTITVNTT